MTLISYASSLPSIRISLRLRKNQAQAKNFCRVLDIRVPQLMEADVGESVLFQEQVESVADVVGGVGMAVRPFEHIGRFLVLLAKCCPVLLLLFLGPAEDRFCFRGEGEAAPAAGVLGLVLGNNLRDLGNRVPDGHGLPFKVDAVPLKSQKLAPAKSVQSGDLHQGQQLVPLEGLTCHALFVKKTAHSLLSLHCVLCLLG